MATFCDHYRNGIVLCLYVTGLQSRAPAAMLVSLNHSVNVCSTLGMICAVLFEIFLLF